ncbi:MAG: NADH:flavin oxidoreductase/NADH oxidase [Pseudomonadota bacterium]
MSAQLFTPHSLGGLTLPNRIVVSPMCQYSADDGIPNDWHRMHLGSMAMSGAGLVFIEATGVNLDQRITPHCPALCNDAQEAAFADILPALRRWGVPGTKFAIQLAAAGRKASARVPWEGGTSIPPEDPSGWQTFSSSAVALAEGWTTPVALDDAALASLKQDFVDAAVRAARIGFDAAELHGAHGYLLHQFLSPLANKRNDRYGGPLENRMAFPLEVFEAVREVWPRERALGMRISATDWVEGGWDVTQSIAFAQELERRGCDFLDVSSGGIVLDATIPVGPLYQVPLAAQLKAALRMPVMAVGLITEAAEAEAVIADEQADFVALARGMLDDPRWPWRAAYRLGAKIEVPPQYARATMETWRPARKYAEG